MKVVFDTNVFVSAFIVPGSKGEDALLLGQRRKVGLYSSVPILTETARILRAKFDQSEEDVTDALKMTGCAATAQADLIVTGDHHLLDLRKFEGIPIVRLADLLITIPSEWFSNAFSGNRAGALIVVASFWESITVGCVVSVSPCCHQSLQAGDLCSRKRRASPIIGRSIRFLKMNWLLGRRSCRSARTSSRH